MLCCHFLGQTKPPCEAHVSQQSLSPATENVLVQWVKYLDATGHPVDKAAIVYHAGIIVGNGQTLSCHWISSFLECHPSICLGKPSGLDPKHVQAFNKPVVNDYFKKLSALVEEHQIPWDQVYNMDEKVCQCDGGRKRLSKKYFI